MRKRSTLLLLFVFMISCTAFLAGCGNNQKEYNQTKNSLVELEGKWDACKTDTAGTKEHEELGKQIQQKLDKMKKLATDDTKLNNDYLATKAQVEEIGKKWQSAKESDDFIDSLPTNQKEPAVDNTWSEASMNEAKKELNKRNK